MIGTNYGSVLMSCVSAMGTFNSSSEYEEQGNYGMVQVVWKKHYYMQQMIVMIMLRGYWWVLQWFHKGSIGGFHKVILSQLMSSRANDQT
mgnify:CR=1 FL=1